MSLSRVNGVALTVCHGIEARLAHTFTCSSLRLHALFNEGCSLEKLRSLRLVSLLFKHGVSVRCQLRVRFFYHVK